MVNEYTVEPPPRLYNSHFFFGPGGQNLHPSTSFCPQALSVAARFNCISFYILIHFGFPLLNDPVPTN